MSNTDKNLWGDEETPKFQVVWDNGSDCGSFSELFDTEQEAEDFGNNWRNDMIAMDEHPRLAARAYSFEVMEVPQEEEDFGQNDTPEQMGWVGKDGQP